MSRARETAEQDLARSLSRYIGYTTGAYNLSRIADVTGLIGKRTFVYEVEVIKSLSQLKVGVRYAKEITNFAVALGLLQRVDAGGRLTRLGLSDLGRSYTAAAMKNDVAFRQLLLTYAVLENDVDAYILVLQLISDTKKANGAAALHAAFVNKMQDLRNARAEWLKRVFPNRMLLSRITSRLEWLQIDRMGKVGIEELGPDFGRHHVTPRAGWAEELSHLDAESHLTNSGAELLSLFLGGSREYFWLGPSQDTLDQLSVPTNERRLPFGPAWNILRPLGKIQDPSDSLLEKLIGFMIDSYPVLRLVHANQAPLGAVLPYLYYLEREEGYRTREREVLEIAFGRARGLIAPLSTRSTVLGFYQMRKNDSRRS